MPAETATVPHETAASRGHSAAFHPDFAEPPRRRLHGLCQERQDAAKLRTALIAHLGGSPSVVQLALCDAAAELKLKIAVADRRFIDQGGMSAHGRREYLAFVNSYSRLLRQIGMKGAAERAPTLADYLATKAAQPIASAAPAPPAPMAAPPPAPAQPLAVASEAAE